MATIEIYTDGGCSGNPGPGGWAYVVQMGNELVRSSGGKVNTTNNQMELQAVIEALRFVNSQLDDKKEPVVLHTDSQYVRQGITNWIHKWLKNNWKTTAKKAVKNKEFWQQLKELDDAIRPDWVWVPGHTGVELNETCDSMVQEQIEHFKNLDSREPQRKERNGNTGQD